MNTKDIIELGDFKRGDTRGEAIGKMANLLVKMEVLKEVTDDQQKEHPPTHTRGH